MAILDNPATRIGLSIVIGGIVVSLILLILPIIPLPAEFASALSWAFNLLWSFDFILPVLTMLTIFGLLIGLDILFASVHLLIFLKKLFTKR